jgi:hypothetical protein
MRTPEVVATRRCSRSVGIGNRTHMTDDNRQTVQGHTVPKKEAIRVDRAAMADDHDVDRNVDPEDAESAPTSVDPEVARAFDEANKTGARIRGEGAVD